MRVGHRRRMHAAGNQSREVGHVHQIESADFVGDLAHAGEINNARISAAASDDQLGTFLLGHLFQVVVVDGFCFLGDAVRDHFVGLAGKIQMMAVGEMAAVREIQAEDGVSRLEHGRNMPPCSPASRNAAARWRARRRIIAWRGRGPGSRQRRHIRIRRSSAFRDSPRHIYW